MRDGSNARALEDAFFRRMDADLLARRRAEEARRDGLAALREATGIADEELLDRMLELNLRPETLCAFRLVPLVAVMWADGSLQPEERRELMAAVEAEGVRKDGAAHAMVERWIAERPSDDLLALWTAYVRELRTVLAAGDLAALRAAVLKRAGALARAAGGFLGMGKVSAEEAGVLARIEAAFDGTD